MYKLMSTEGYKISCAQNMLINYQFLRQRSYIPSHVITTCQTFNKPAYWYKNRNGLLIFSQYANGMICTISRPYCYSIEYVWKWKDSYTLYQADPRICLILLQVKLCCTKKHIQKNTSCKLNTRVKDEIQLRRSYFGFIWKPSWEFCPQTPTFCAESLYKTAIFICAGRHYILTYKNGGNTCP